MEEVSDIAYDKAVEVVTDTVRQETHKEDLRLVEETRNWVLSPERKAPQKEREYAAARLDGVISKIKSAMQSALTKIQQKNPSWIFCTRQNRTAPGGRKSGKSNSENRIWSGKASDFANKSDAFPLRR